MSNLSASVSLCEAAAAECYAAADLLPLALDCGRLVDEGKADAGLVLDAGSTWRDAHQALGEAAADLRRIVAAVPDDVWSGKDRAAYERRIAEFDRQCHDVATYAEAGALTLTALAGGLAGFAALASGVSLVLAGTAIYVAAADATIIAAPEAEATGNAIAADCLSCMEGASEALQAAMEVGAGVLGLAEVLDVGIELQHGSRTVLPDFVQAEVSAGLEGQRADLQDRAEEQFEETLDDALDDVLGGEGEPAPDHRTRRTGR